MRLSSIVVIFLVMLHGGGAFGDDEPVVTPHDLANLRDIGGHAKGAINVSPDGRWIVFQLQTPKISDGDYELTWMSVTTRDGGAVRIADGGDVLLNPTLSAFINGDMPPVRAAWAPDSKSFVYLVRRNGQTQLWRSRPDRKGQIQLTHNEGDIIDFSWSHDGSVIYFTAGLDKAQLAASNKNEGARGFLYDDRIVPWKGAHPIMRDCGFSHDLPLMQGIARACEPALWIYEFKTKKERLATEEEKAAFDQLNDNVVTPEEIEDRSIKRLRQSAEGSRYAWLENTDPEEYPGIWAPLTIFALIDGEVRQCVEVVCRAYDNPIRGHEDMWWSAKGEEVIFLRRDGPSHSLTGVYGWTPSTGAIRKIFQSDDWLSDCALQGHNLICLYEIWTEPRKIASISLDDGAVTSIFNPNPDFARHRLPKVEKLEWKDAFGNTTYGHLVYPIGYQQGRAYPLVIVTYYSHGFLRGGVGDEYPIFPLAAEGFFVLRQEMPLDTELAARSSEPTVKLNEDQYLRRSVLTSQEIIIKQLAQAGVVDGGRVAITGLSEGQAQVSYALIHSDAFATAIASSAWISPSSFYLMGDIYRESERLTNGSPDDPNSLDYALSLGLNADQVDAPLLINVSDDEFLGSVENIARLRDAGKIVEAYVYPGDYHNKWRPDHRFSIYRRNIQWLKFWLNGEEEDDPVSPGQYERWRDMRDKRCAWAEPQNEKPAYCDYSSTKH